MMFYTAFEAVNHLHLLGDHEDHDGGERSKRAL